MGKTRLAAAAALGIGLLACGSAEEARTGQAPAVPPVSAAPPETPEPALVAEPEPLVVATRSVTPEERVRFEAELAEQVELLRKQLDSVRELAEHETGDLGDELERRTRRLEDKNAELERKLASMKKASEHEWLELRGDVGRLVGDIQEESGRMIEALH